MLPDGELAAWLRLLLTPGLGRGGARRLLAAFGSAEAVVEAGPCAWRSVLPQAPTQLADRPERFDEQFVATQQWLEGDSRRSVVTLGDPHYPPLLLQTADPPLILFAQGRLDCLASDAVAIVGSRHPTPQGRDNAREFASAFSCTGLCVVSGLALGIDGAAHEGALTGSGSTIAVVGTGLDRVYPPQHHALAHRITEQGLLLSEFPLGTPPLPANFPMRNRIIAGLSLGTLVAEAAVRSGSLITARLAAEMGREVFAIPGSIHSPQSRGCHALIKVGAKLVEAAQDVMEELRRDIAQLPATTTSAPSDAQPLLEALGYDPCTLDSLAARTGWPLATLGAQLLELELQGHVARLPGGLYQRRSTA